LGRRVLLVAGGTGGHLFPALALREVLVRRGWAAHVATDPRVGELVEGVPAAELHRIASATFSLGSPLGMLRAAATLLKGLRQSRKLLKRIRPAAIVGFGGYPTIPPALAARLAGLPIIVHEQNAVVGRANRLLLRRGAILATGFKDPRGADRALQSVYVGNPVRKGIISAVRPYEKPTASAPFRLLVFGGSQGAHVFSKLIPAALEILPEENRWRVMVVQQARNEDLQSTRSAFEKIHVDAEVEPFFSNMGDRIADAHLVVCRAGASTVAELAAIGRPAILVPYPHALEHDQAENGRVIVEAGGGWLIPEAELTPTVLARRLGELMENPEELVNAAAAAHAEGRVDAAEQLADLVEDVAKTKGTL